MKIRLDFVTNSSSSSFVCEICGRTEGGFEASLEDFGMVECENGHIVCQDELLNKDYEDFYEVPEECCPICQFIEYSNSDLKDYLKQKYNITDDVVFAEVKKVNPRRKKLYDTEYNTYVCQQYNLNPAEIVSHWKEDYGTYSNFRKSMRV